MFSFRESGHPVFRASSVLKRGTLQSNGGGQLSVHNCGDSDTAELIVRTIVSVSQLRIYGAVSDWCEELAERISNYSEQSAGRLAPKDKSETTMAPTAVSAATNPLLTNSPEQGNLLRQHIRTFSKRPNDIRVIKTCSDVGFMGTVGIGQYFTTIHEVEMAKLGCPEPCREYTLPQVKRMDSRGYKNWSSIGSHSVFPPKSELALCKMVGLSPGL